MKKQLWLILIAVEVLILFAMLLADFGVIHASVAPLSPRSIRIFVASKAVKQLINGLLRVLSVTTPKNINSVITAENQSKPILSSMLLLRFSTYLSPVP